MIRNQLKPRHYVVGLFGLVGIVGAIISIATGRNLAASPIEQLASILFYPLSFLLLISCVIAYSLKKEGLSKLFVTLGLGIMALLIIAGCVLYTISGEVTIFPYILIFTVLCIIALLLWLFLRE